MQIFLLHQAFWFLLFLCLIYGLISLLDIHQISIIYLTPDLKSSLPADYGLLALLNTENFKLVHSYQGIEVWFYSKIVNEEVKN